MNNSNAQKGRPEGLSFIKAHKLKRTLPTHSNSVQDRL